MAVLEDASRSDLQGIEPSREIAPQPTLAEPLQPGSVEGVSTRVCCNFPSEALTRTLTSAEARHSTVMWYQRITND